MRNAGSLVLLSEEGVPVTALLYRAEDHPLELAVDSVSLVVYDEAGTLKGSTGTSSCDGHLSALAESAAGYYLPLNGGLRLPLAEALRLARFIRGQSCLCLTRRSRPSALAERLAA